MLNWTEYVKQSNYDTLSPENQELTKREYVNKLMQDPEFSQENDVTKKDVVAYINAYKINKPQQSSVIRSQDMYPEDSAFTFKESRFKPEPLGDQSQNRGFGQSILKGIESSSLYGLSYPPIEKKPDYKPYQPEGFVEKVGVGLGQVVGDLPVFMLARDKGFSAVRMIHEYNKVREQQKQDIPDLSLSDLGNIAIEGIKGYVEGKVVTKTMGGVDKALGQYLPDKALLFAKGGAIGTALTGTSPILDLPGHLVRKIKGEESYWEMPGVTDWTSNIALGMGFGAFGQKYAWNQDVQIKVFAEKMNMPVKDARQIVRSGKASELIKQKLQEDIQAQKEIETGITNFETELNKVLKDPITKESVNAEIKNNWESTEKYTSQRIADIIESKISLDKQEKIQSVILDKEILGQIDKPSKKSLLREKLVEDKLNQYNFDKYFNKEPIEKSKFEASKEFARNETRSLNRSIAEGTQIGKQGIIEVEKTRAQKEFAMGEAKIAILDAVEPFIKNRNRVIMDKKYQSLFEDLSSSDKDAHGKIIEEYQKNSKHPLSEKELIQMSQAVEAFDIVKNNLITKAQTDGLQQIQKDGKTRVPIEKQPNYMHEEVNWAKVNESDVTRKRFIENLVDRNVLSKEIADKIKALNGKELQKAIDGLQIAEAPKQRIRGAQHERTLTPYLDRDFVLRDFNKTVKSLIEMAGDGEWTKKFGSNYELLYKWKDAVAKEALTKYSPERAYAEEKRIQHIIETISGDIPQSNSLLARFGRGIQNFNIITMMPLSFISQSTQSFATLWVNGFMNTFNTIGKQAFKKPFHTETINGKEIRYSARELHESIGTNVKLALNEYNTALTGDIHQQAAFTKGTGFLLDKMTLFTSWDAANRTGASLVGATHLDALAKSVEIKLNKYIDKHKSDGIIDYKHIPDNVLNKMLESETYWLGRLNVNIGELITNGKWSGTHKNVFEVKPTLEQKKIAMRSNEVNINLRAENFDLPPLWRGEIGKLIHQFKSYSFETSKLVRDNVIKPAVTGDFKPLLGFLIVSGITTMSNNEIRSLFTKHIPNGVANWLEGKDPIDIEKNSPFLKMIKDNKQKEYVIDTLAKMANFLVIDQAYGLIKYNDWGAGPTANRLTKGATAIHDAYKTESAKPILSNLANYIPFVPGWAIGRTIMDSMKISKEQYVSPDKIPNQIIRDAMKNIPNPNRIIQRALQGR